jgi:hypothetical protein
MCSSWSCAGTCSCPATRLSCASWPWLVSLLVIAGVLLMVLLANGVASRVRGFTSWLYLPLIGSILLVYAVPTDAILRLSFAGWLAWTLLVVPIPIFFAGLVFSGTFKRTSRPSAAFGANLVGAMVGGFAEYLSMASGRRSLVLVVIGAYLVSLLATTIAERALLGENFLSPPRRSY